MCVEVGGVKETLLTKVTVVLEPVVGEWNNKWTGGLMEGWMDGWVD